MSDTTIDPMVQLGNDIDTAFERTKCGHQEWIDGSLDLAAALAKARKAFKHNADFGGWLVKNKHDHVSKDDRAGLIGLGRDLKLAREVLEKTTSNSYQHIWKAEKSRFPAEETVRHVTNTRPNRKIQPKRPTNNPPQAREWTKRHPWFNRKRGEEINAAFVNKNAVWGINDVMTKIGKTGGDDLWKMMIQCYDAGFIVESRYYPNGDHDPCSLRLLFPHTPIAYAKQFRMTHDRQRKYVRDNIVPAALANIDAVLADPENLEAIVAKHLGIHLDPSENEDAGVVAPETEKTNVMTATAPAPKVETPEPKRTSMHPRYLSPQEVDPEFTGTPREFTAKYGHVQIHTAEQFATMRFSDWSGYFKALAKYARGMPPLPEKAVDRNWLRNPKETDVAKLSEALEYLRPLIVEAEALLVTAAAAVLKKKEAPKE